MNNKLLIIIVNWNKKDFLQKCLNSIYLTIKNINCKVIVVDNASTDGSAEMVKSEFTWANLIVNQENLGFAKANNQAIKDSDSEYILLLNNDTELLPESVEKMINFMDNNVKAGMVGPRLLNKDRSIQDSYWMKFPSLVIVFCKYFYLFQFLKLIENKLSESNREPFKVAHLLGACILVRKEVVGNVGLMDEQFFMYLEETDWCYRMVKKGWSIYYLPEAKVIHFGQQSSRDNPLITTREGPKSYIKYFRKHNNISIFKISILKSIIIIGTLIRLMVYYYKYIFKGKIIKKDRINANWNVIKEIVHY